MNAYQNKNGVKLFALVAVLAMVFAGAAVVMSDDGVDAATTTSNGTTYISGDVTSTQKFNSATNVVVNDDLEIPAGMALIIEGTFTLNEGCTITIDAGGQLIFNGAKAVTINGDIVADGVPNPVPESGYVAAIVNNMAYTPADKVGFFVNGNITLQKGAELISSSDATSTSVGYTVETGDAETGEDEETPATDNTESFTPAATSGNIVINNGGSLSITKRSSNVSAIESQNVYLYEGATLTLNGYAKAVTINAIGDASYYTAGSVLISYYSGNSEATSYPANNRTTADLTFTVTTETASAFIGTADNAKKVTIRQYIVNVEGTVDGIVTDDDTHYYDKLTVQPGNNYNKDNTSSTTTAYAGTAVYYAVGDDGKVDNTAPFVPKSSITGNLEITGNGVVEIAKNAYVNQSGNVTVGYNEDLETTTGGTTTYASNLIIGGTIYVTGTTQVADGGSMKDGDDTTGTGYGRIIIDGGKIDVTNYNTTVADGLYVYGAWYEDDVSTDPVTHFRDLDVAVTEAAAAGVSEVYVYAYTSSLAPGSYENAVAGGAYIIDTDITIPDGITLIIGTILAIDENATLTFAEGSDVDFQTYVGNNVVIYVNGKLVDEEGAFDGIADQRIDYEVKKVSEDQLVTTYTTLKIALSEAQPGETITLNGTVTVSDNMEIPSQVTVVTDVDEEETSAITVNGATLTINGTLQMANDATVTIKDDGNKKGSIVLNNIIANATVDSITGSVAGAYFNGTIGEETTDYITSVAVAAQNSATVTEDITLMGKLSIGDVTFTQGEDNYDLDVIIAPGAEITAGTVTLVGADLGFSTAYQDKTVFSGTITVAATAGDVTMSFDKAAGFMFETVDTDDGATITTTVAVSGTGAMTTTNGTNKISGSTTIMSGTVDVNSKVAFDNLVVSEGATLALGDDAEVFAASTIDMSKLENFADYPYDLDAIAENSKGIIVNGTITISEGAIIGWGPFVINGTMTVADNNSTGVNVDILDVHGTLTVGENSKVTADLILVDGTITGDIDMKVTFAYPGSDLTAAGISMEGDESTAESTAYYVNGELYTTIYTTVDMPVEILIVFSDVNGVVASTAELYADEAMNDLIYAVPATGANYATLYNYFMNTVFGDETAADVSDSEKTKDYDAIYAAMDPASINGTITVYSGMKLYIDGQAIENFYDDKSGNYALSVGEHQFAVQVNPGFTGTTTFTLDGQTVTGGSFTISQDAKSFQIVVTGEISQDVPVSGGDNGGDDGLGLTDYLLIILVILIVVMAIMVAMRLMRS